jgi:hypothetical protein
MANKCVKELVSLLMYSRFTPTCFGKWLPSSGGRRCVRSYSSSVCIVVVYTYVPAVVDIPQLATLDGS